jgi:hypothetical protein
VEINLNILTQRFAKVSAEKRRGIKRGIRREKYEERNTKRGIRREKYGGSMRDVLFGLMNI